MSETQMVHWDAICELTLTPRGYQERTKKLFKEDPEIANLVDANGCTLLSYCILYNSEETDLIKFMIDKTNNLEALDKKGRNAFDNAVMKKLSEEILYLIDYKMAEKILKELEGIL